MKPTINAIINELNHLGWDVSITFTKDGKKCARLVRKKKDDTEATQIMQINVWSHAMLEYQLKKHYQALLKDYDKRAKQQSAR